MSEPRDEWERWREDWQAGGATVDARQLPARMRRERRRMLVASAVEGALALAACGGIAAALVHTPHGFDAWWGIAVLVMLAGSWAIATWLRRRAEAPSFADATEDFVALSRRRCRRQLRAVHFAWLLAALELAFLVPWWIGGYRVHGLRPGSVLTVLAWWLPAAAILGLFAGTLHLRRRVRAELEQLDRLQAAIGADLADLANPSEHPPRDRPVPL
jgi:cytochrome c-type biogenesis protein CcmH/NrfF